MKTSFVTLIGCGAQAKYALDIFSLLDIKVASIFDPIGKKINTTLGDHLIKDPVTFFSALMERGRDNLPHVLVCMSDNSLKSEYYHRLESRVTLINAVHPESTLSDTASLGAGIIVNAKAVIQPYASIGNGCMIHSGVVVEHDNEVGDFVNLAPGVILSGGVKIGTGTTLFSGTTVGPNVAIGKNVTIGAGSLVLHDIPDGVKAYGSPAKAIGKTDK